jgi:CheY-like chemotaxis protein
MVCRILVADDSSTIQKVIRIGLAGIPCDIKSVGSYAEALKAVDSERFDLLIADAGLPGITSVIDFTKLTERMQTAPMILLIGSYDVVREVDLRTAGIENIIRKPFSPSDLPQMVQKLIGTPPPSPMGGVVAGPHPARSQSEFPGLNFGERKDFAVNSSSNPTDYGTNSPSPPIGFTSPPSFNPSHIPEAPPRPEVELGLRGLPAFSLTAPDQAELRKSFSQSGDLKGLTNLTMASGNFSEVNTNNGLSSALEALVAAQLPALIDQAVEKYCAQHFKGVAREAIISELRRLADEKARYLVEQ